MKSEIKTVNTEPDEDGDIWFTFPPTTYRISLNNDLDLSYLNEKLHSRIIIKKGHFYDLKTNKRIRFFGTNVVGADAFPSKDDSPLLAKRMAQLGINLVRFHHMDHHDIWLDHTNSIFNPEKIDLLHYFLFCLHRNGIYANINLHVTREYPEEEYSKSSSEFKQLFHFGKCLDRFYPPFINDQIQYSIDLLNTYNVYTKCKVGDDPMVLNVELNNENSMVDLTHPIKMNAIKGTVFEIELKSQWQKWLQNKYHSIENIIACWNPKEEQIDRSIELLNGLKYGYQKDKNTELKIDKNDRPAFEFSINQIPMYTWSNQIHFYSFPLQTNTIYTVEFEAKAIQNSEQKEKLTATVMFEENKPPWKIYSIKNQVVNLNDEFQKFSVVLTSAASLETEDKTATMICKIIICPKVGVYTFKNICVFRGKEINQCFSKDKRKSQNNELTELKFNPNEGIYGELLKYLRKGYQKDENTVINMNKKDDDYPSYEFSINQIPKFTWSNQIHFYTFPLKADTTYTIEFEAKAIQNSESKEKLTATAMFEENKPPWKIYSIKNQVVNLTDQFQKYSINLTSAKSLETEDKTATMMFKIIICPKVGIYTFKNIKAFYGVIEHKEIEEEEKIIDDEEEDNENEEEINFEDVLLPDSLTFPNQANRDFRLFINDVETSTQQKLSTFIKNSFPRSRILIVDSQAVYGNMFSYEREYENSDFIDNHAYWQHPTFDKGFTWHKDHYSIKNTPMFSSTDFGTFSNLTLFKPYGKPYTISEYNHAFPNEHLHEKFPMFGSWAAFHDWDAIYQFAFGQVSRNTEHFVDYFSMARNPMDIAFAPFLVLAFRKFYVPTSDKYVHLKIPKSFIFEQNEKGRILSREVIQPYYAGWPSQFDVEIINDDHQKMDEIKIDTNIDINEKGQFITEEIIWNDTYQIKTPKMKTITGMIGDSNKSIENDLDLLKIRIKLNEKLNESATVGIVSLDDKELENSGKILLVIAGKTKNTNQKWNKDRTSTGRVDEGCNWGCAPILVQFIEFDAILFLQEKEKPTIWTINEFGEKNKTLEIENLEIRENKYRWAFKSNLSMPSLSFIIERKL
ncbi:hypothetical protein M9Y10_032282 [Tritrichomonas musculus]|uniref:Glycoside hydrolase family 5 domain-containing protein n=1 Tax=Tritrichomonas musculus TaxID=1915356 RepID=A0ABR2H0G9_9EUKA